MNINNEEPQMSNDVPFPWDNVAEQAQDADFDTRREWREFRSAARLEDVIEREGRPSEPQYPWDVPAAPAPAVSLPWGMGEEADFTRQATVQQAPESVPTKAAVPEMPEFEFTGESEPVETESARRGLRALFGKREAQVDMLSEAGPASTGKSRLSRGERATGSRGEANGAKRAERDAARAERQAAREQAGAEKQKARADAAAAKAAARSEKDAEKVARDAPKIAAREAKRAEQEKRRAAAAEAKAEKRHAKFTERVERGREKERLRNEKIDARDAAKAAKAEARATKVDLAKQLKAEAQAEKKRDALLAKEEKERAKRLRREATEEGLTELADQRARIARDRRARRERLRKQRRRDAISRNGGKAGFWQGTSKPKPIEITNAIRALSIILETSAGEIDPVKMMAEEFAGNPIGDAFDRIYGRLVKDNMTLVDAFAPEEVFPAVVHNMLRVGAKTAKPGPALRVAVDLMESGNEHTRKMANAIREPVIVALLSMGILFGTAYWVVPMFLGMYKSLHMEVGLMTQFVVTFSDVSVWIIAGLAVLSLAWAIWWFAYGRNSLRVRVAIDRYKLRAPLMGKAEQTAQAFQMFNILTSYLSVGATEREALVDTAIAIENRAIKRHLRATANGLVTGEKTFVQFLDDEMFPALARSVLATGQRSGQTNQVIRDLRDIYRTEAEVEGDQAVEKVVGTVSAFSSILFTVTASIVSVPPLEIFGATLGYTG